LKGFAADNPDAFTFAYLVISYTAPNRALEAEKLLRVYAGLNLDWYVLEFGKKMCLNLDILGSEDPLTSFHRLKGHIMWQDLFDKDSEAGRELVKWYMDRNADGTFSYANMMPILSALGVDEADEDDAHLKSSKWAQFISDRLVPACKKIDSTFLPARGNQLKFRRNLTDTKQMLYDLLRTYPYWLPTLSNGEIQSKALKKHSLSQMCFQLGKNLGVAKSYCKGESDAMRAVMLEAWEQLCDDDSSGVFQPTLESYPKPDPDYFVNHFKAAVAKDAKR
jgi:hypothetical protein